MKLFKRVLPLLIYLSGCVIAYPIAKRAYIQRNTIIGIENTWTVGDRNRVLRVCIFSWVTVVGVGLSSIFWGATNNPNTPANW